MKSEKLEQYLTQYDVEWKYANEFPEHCPPDRIFVPEDGEKLYRLTKDSNCCTEEDFIPYKKQFPDKNYKNECLVKAWGLSTYNSYDEIKNKQRLPALKELKGIVEIEMNPTLGVVKQTGHCKSHITWWHTTALEIDRHCNMK